MLNQYQQRMRYNKLSNKIAVHTPGSQPPDMRIPENGQLHDLEYAIHKMRYQPLRHEDLKNENSDDTPNYIRALAIHHSTLCPYLRKP